MTGETDRATYLLEQNRQIQPGIKECASGLNNPRTRELLIAAATANRESIRMLKGVLDGTDDDTECTLNRAESLLKAAVTLEDTANMIYMTLSDVSYIKSEWVYE
jgi:hypothetical protein